MVNLMFLLTIVVTRAYSLKALCGNYSFDSIEPSSKGGRGGKIKTKEGNEK